MLRTIFMSSKHNGDFSAYNGGPSGFCSAEAKEVNLDGTWCACVSRRKADGGWTQARKCQACGASESSLFVVGDISLTAEGWVHRVEGIPNKDGTTGPEQKFWNGFREDLTCEDWTKGSLPNSGSGSNGRTGPGTSGWTHYSAGCDKEMPLVCVVRQDAVEVYLSERTIAAIGEVAGKAAVLEACNSAAGLHQNISKLLLAQKTQLEADQLEQRQKQVKEHAEYVQDYSTERSQRREQITTVEHVAETTYVKAQQQAHKDLLKQELDSHIAEQQLQLEKFDLSTERGNTTIANDHKDEKQKLEAKQKAQRDLQENQHQQILDGTPASTQTGVEVSGFIKRSTE